MSILMIVIFFLFQDTIGKKKKHEIPIHFWVGNIHSSSYMQQQIKEFHRVFYYKYCKENLYYDFFIKGFVEEK